MLKILKSNEKYNENIKNYTKKDGVLALILFLIMIILYSILGILNNIEFIHKNIMIFGCIINTLMIIIAILFVKINKQNLFTIGLIKGRIKLSLIIGKVLGLFYFYCNCISHLLVESHLISFSKILFLIIYFLLVALCEEIVFRGYIGTRINGLIKNKYFAICFTGLLFVLMHFPYRMIEYNLTLNNLIIGKFDWLLNLFIFHITMNFIYMKTNSLYGSIMVIKFRI